MKTHASPTPMSILWQRFKHEGCQHSRDELIERHAHLCSITAGRILGNRPAHVETDDLVSEGYCGLIKAVDQFDPARGILFTTYAIQLISGAMKESLRENDWVPRLLRDQNKQITSAKIRLERSLGRVPGAGELARELCWPIDYLEEVLQGIARTNLLSLQSPLHTNVDDRQMTIADVLHSPALPILSTLPENEEKDMLQRAIQRLPEREKIVIGHYFEEEITYKDIGMRLQISESRAYQLVQQALKRLKHLLIGHDIGLDEPWACEGKSDGRYQSQQRGGSEALFADDHRRGCY